MPWDWRGILILEHRYKVEALSFKALPESGVGCWGNEEVQIGGMLDTAKHLGPLQELGFSTADGLGPALRACTATRAVCRPQN